MRLFEYIISVNDNQLRDYFHRAWLEANRGYVDPRKYPYLDKAIYVYARDHDCSYDDAYLFAKTGVKMVGLVNNRSPKMDFFDDINEEREDDYFIDAQMMANSREEALDLVGDDTFYDGVDLFEEDESVDFLYVGTEFLSQDQKEMLLDAGIDPDELEHMPDDEVKEVLESAGFDIFDFSY